MMLCVMPHLQVQTGQCSVPSALPHTDPESRSSACSSKTISPFASAKVSHRKYAFTFKILLVFFFSSKHRKYLKHLYSCEPLFIL